MMRICTTFALALALTAVTACKKDNKDGGGSTKVTDNKPPEPGSAAEPPAPPPEPEQPLAGAELAARYSECLGHINAGELDKFAALCMADTYAGHDAGMHKDMKRDDVVAMFTAVRKGAPDLKLEAQLVLVNGRTIAAVGLMTGTHSAAWEMPGAPPMPATNKKFGQLYFHRLKLDDTNKATEEWIIDDASTMMGQLGMTPKEAPPVRPVPDKGMEGAPIVVVAADNDTEKANLAMWKQATAAVNAHKAKDMIALWADDGVESDQAEGTDHKGKKEIQKSTEMFLKAFPDMKIESTEDWAAGDYVVMIGTATGTNKGPLGKMKKTGKSVTIPFAEVGLVKGGKIAMLWRFRSGMDMAMQLGLMPMPPAAGAAPAAPAAAKDDTK